MPPVPTSDPFIATSAELEILNQPTTISTSDKNKHTENNSEDYLDIFFNNNNTNTSTNSGTPAESLDPMAALAKLREVYNLSSTNEDVDEGDDSDEEEEDEAPRENNNNNNSQAHTLRKSII